MPLYLTAAHTSDGAEKLNYRLLFHAAARAELLPEAAGARSHGGGASSLLVRDALGAEVFGEEVQLVRRGLERQLVQLLLG